MNWAEGTLDISPTGFHGRDGALHRPRVAICEMNGRSQTPQRGVPTIDAIGQEPGTFVFVFLVQGEGSAPRSLRVRYEFPLSSVS